MLLLFTEKKLRRRHIGRPPELKMHKSKRKLAICRDLRPFSYQIRLVTVMAVRDSV